MAATERAKVAACRLRGRGVVQGIGLRPLVYRLARHLGLTGWVRNDGQGVTIHVEGPPRRLDRFRDWLVRKALTAADVAEVEGGPAPRSWTAPPARCTSAARSGSCASWTSRAARRYPASVSRHILRRPVGSVVLSFPAPD